MSASSSRSARLDDVVIIVVILPPRGTCAWVAPAFAFVFVFVFVFDFVLVFDFDFAHCPPNLSPHIFHLSHGGVAQYAPRPQFGRLLAVLDFDFALAAIAIFEKPPRMNYI